MKIFEDNSRISTIFNIQNHIILYITNLMALEDKSAMVKYQSKYSYPILPLFLLGKNHAR